MLENFNRADWIEVRRGFGSIELSELAEDECVTASGLHDGGYIVWRRKAGRMKHMHEAEKHGICAFDPELRG